MMLDLKEIMFTFMSVVVMTYWMSNSLVIQLIMLVLYVILSSIVIYWISNMFMVSYIMLFSVISGLIVVLSFVFMSESNLESSSMVGKSVNVLLFPLLVSFMIMSMPADISAGWSILLVDQFSLFSSFSADLYLLMFMFMVFVLLMMLFVIDLILLSHGGSMLPMK